MLRYSVLSLFAFPLMYVNGGGSPSSFSDYSDLTGTRTIPFPVDTPVNLPYPFNDRLTDPYSNPYDHSPLYGTTPSNVNTSVEYNPETREYDINEKIGKDFFRNPSYMTFEEFKEDQFRKSTQQYWKERAEGEDAITRKPLIPKIYVAGETFDRIFGGNTIDIRPQGSAELTFGVNINRTDNPQIPEKQRRLTSFDFNEKIQMNVIGNIGEKMKLSVNYNTEASFDFENQMKLEYTGYEDEIIRKIEAGNVTLPLTGTLIKGSQSLFGIKTQLQFGRLGVTTIFSQQKGQASTINVPPGGGQVTNFDIDGDQYEANRHFYISQYFREHYDEAVSKLPTIVSPISITKIEVWITQVNFNSQDQTRNLVAMQDLGEYNAYASSFVGQGTSVYPSDQLSNNLYQKLTTTYSGIRNFQSASSVLDPLSSVYNFSPQQDYELITNAKKLSSTDFTYNEKLGFISLNSELRNDQALAVAFEYTVNGKVYRVGELTTSGIDPSQPLIVKLIRGRNFNTTLPSWKLMMKNVYNLNAFQISSEKFRLDVLYFDNAAGSYVRQLPEPSEPNIANKSLIRILNADNLNSSGDATQSGDGIFDYVEGITVNSATGRIILPSVEPFGRYLESKFSNTSTAAKYVFKELYDSTKTIALAQGKNKFKLKGSYQSSSGSEISLNAINIPQGSVKVTAGGTELVENQDYTVDYNLGRVKIINTSVLNSATPIKVSLESNSLFSVQSKTLMGARFDYKFSKDFAVGGTFMHLNERPITRKVNIGDEPISNSIFGLDGTYRTRSRFITKLVDKIPLINTKEESSVSLNGEFAYLLPGHSKAIGKKGNAYIDAFEGTQSTIPLNIAGQWFLASVPRFQPTLFPEFDYVSTTNDTLGYGYNRAKIAWYNIDPTAFYRSNSTVSLSAAERSNHNVRQISEKELFPKRQYSNGIVPYMNTFDISFYPDERGPYNYETSARAGLSAGIDANGNLVDPSSRWGGFMRKVETSNFEESNIQYIQFWLMDPFNGDAPDSSLSNTGTLYFNLGDISEDVLRDGYESYENGLPTTATPAAYRQNAWGRTPVAQNVLYAFDRDESTRKQQDVGLDGLGNDDEKLHFLTNFLDYIDANVTNQTVKDAIHDDPSSDDFSYFRGDAYTNADGILKRYKNFNGTENNSPVAGSGTFVPSSTQTPDAEDANRINGMEVDENYFQYKVDIDPSKLVVGQNYVSDVLENVAALNLPDASGKTITWYLIKIPVNDPTRERIGQISDLKSVKFIRVFAKGFSGPKVLRLAKFEFLRGEWRKYDYKLTGILSQPAVFDVGAVSLEENSNREPINYVLPPDFEREIDVTSTNQRQLNEQSLSFKVCELADGDMKVCYKNTTLDMRNYKHVKMVIHAESFLPPANPTNDGELYAVVRLGSDFTDNYYDYRIPLKMTPFGSTDPNVIWPKENDFDIDLDKLTDAKLERNNAGVAFTDEYSKLDGNNVIFIKGNPTLSEVKVMMLGLWNPSGENPAFPPRPPDDGLAKCAEVWFNEFRMSDFNDKGGWATIGRAQVKLADLGNVSVSGGYSTHGFGSLESKVGERSKEDVTNYDVATSLELGKFFPSNTGLTVPMYFGYGEVFSNPQYDPLDPDIEFSRSISNIDDSKRKQNRKRFSQDYTRRKSLNFTNVKKNKTGKNASKSRIYDIENFNFTYGYTEVYRRNINTEYDIQKDYLGAIGYNFNTNPKPITPFSKMKGKSKYLRPVKDFNFNYMPSTFNFRWDVNRHYGELKVRDVNAVLNQGVSDNSIPVLYDKRFTMNRQYGTSWDITRALKFEFNANNQSKVDEPDGALNSEEKRDSVRKNFFNLGRNTDYMHNASLSYNLPLNKLPITDWISINTRYSTTYHWTASPLIVNPDNGRYYTNPALGNTIQNSNSIQVNNSLNMTSLYNKWKLYKKLTAPPKPKTPKKKEPKVEAKAPDAAKDSLKTKSVKPPEKKKEQEINPTIKALAKVIFSLKNVSFNWNETNGLLLPGFNRQSEWLGQNWDGSSAPGFAFTFGSQNQDIRERAAKNGWLTTDSTFNSQFTSTYTQNITGRATLEPFTGFNIDVNFNRNYSLSTTENYRAFNSPRANGRYYETLARVETGNFSISNLMWGTSFTKDRKDYSSTIFERFAENRRILSERLGNENPNSSGVGIDGYRDGYSGTSQEVVILSFLSAYSKKSASRMSLDLFPSIPLPNWTVRYDGLTKIAFVKNLFQSVNLNHGYRSTYNVNSFTTDVSYVPGGNARDINMDFIPKRQIGQVSLSEQFSPLIGIDITWKNRNNKSSGSKSATERGGRSSGGNFTTRFEYKRDRNISLTLAGIQVTEVKGREFTFGAGYRIPNFKFPFGLFKSVNSRRSNDLNTTLDFSVRKNTTILRKLVEGTNQPTAGLTIISIKLASDYTVSERLNLRFFFEKTINTPVVSTSYPNANTAVGITIRFTLSQ
ncbi:MAG TPA: cell surface protein SprA [Bacteroidia bacterium]|nr:cell surface protein SprA [Bacteroidia bacterium]